MGVSFCGSIGVSLLTVLLGFVSLVPSAATPANPPRNPLRDRSSPTTVLFLALLISILIGVLVVFALNMLSVSRTPGLSSDDTILNQLESFNSLASRVVKNMALQYLP